MKQRKRWIWKWRKLLLKCLLARLMFAGADPDNGRCKIKPSFSQNGEDLLLWRLFHYAGIVCPNFVDIGAHHPVSGNNTYLFYLMGARGINIEPDPHLFAEFGKTRPCDMNLNLGVGLMDGESAFYRMSDPSLNTFVADEARRLEAEEGIAIVEKIPVPVRRVNRVLEEAPFKIDLLSVDAEGLDYKILEDIDYDRFKPGVICAETLSFSTRGKGCKKPHIRELLESKGYVVCADTHINTIFRRLPESEPAGGDA